MRWPAPRRLLIPFGALALISVLWNGLLLWKHSSDLETDRTDFLKSDATSKALNEFLAQEIARSKRISTKFHCQNVDTSNRSVTDSLNFDLKSTITQVNITDKSEKENKPSNTQKPYFILHVGPPKTATTTIQCGLENVSVPLALNDSYYFVGKQCPHQKDIIPNGEKQIQGHQLMMGIIYGNPTSRGVEQLKRRMEFHHARGNHMIFSLEAMAGHLEDTPQVWELFKSIFEGWNLRIVVAYRHYFDWIRSMYFQSYIGDKYSRWPHDKNGRAHPSFQEYLGYHLTRWETKDIDKNDPRAFGVHLSLSTFQKFAHHFHDVQIFNLHQEGDPLTNFVCQMLPTADAVCQSLSERYQHVNDTSVHRVSHSFDAERLAFAAYEKGLIDGKRISKKTLAKRIQKYMKETGIGTDLDYLQCLPNDVEARFLNASVTFERDLMTESHNLDPASDFYQNTSSHVALFQQALGKRKFCEIDPEKVLKDDGWVQFFKRNNK